MTELKDGGRLATIAFLIMALALVYLGMTAPAAAASIITVKVDGAAVAFPDQQPFADANSRVLVPIRFPMEAMGVSAEWLPDSQQARLTKGSTTAIFTLGSRSYSINGVSKTMDTVPIAMGGRTLFPIRFAAEAFGATASWDGPNNTVLIVTAATPPVLDAPEPVIYKYPEDDANLADGVLMKVTPGMDGDTVKVICTNNDTVNVRPVRDINNNITGSTRLDGRWMSYYDLAATAYYGDDGTFQLLAGTVLTLDIWIQWRDSNHISHKALVLTGYNFVVPDTPWN